MENLEEQLSKFYHEIPGIELDHGLLYPVFIPDVLSDTMVNIK